MSTKATHAPAGDATAWEAARSRAEAWGLLPITVTTQCGLVGTPPDERAPHPVTMRADGSVDTGHDIASERVAAALGGRVTCLDLVDRTVPALVSWLAAQLRIVPPPVSSQDGRRWTLTERASCCARSYPLVLPAVRHSRSALHAAARHGAPVEQVSEFAAAFQERLAAGSPVAGEEGVDVLWQHGLSREYCRGVARQLELEGSIPLAVHLALLGRKPDLAWLRPVIAAHLERDPKLAAQIVWQADRWQAVPESQRVRWLTEPIPPNLSLTLATQGVSLQAVRDLAHAESATMTWAAGIWASWLAVGITPAVADFRALSAVDGGVRPAPSREQIDRTRRLADGAPDCTDQQIAFALLHHGATSPAAAALKGT